VSVNVEMLQRLVLGDTKPRGQARSPLLEPYTRSIFCGLNQKIPYELLPALRAVRLRLVRSMKTRSRNEDDKLSTEPGQLHVLLAQLLQLTSL
jgi:hypothetical protein